MKKWFTLIMAGGLILILTTTSFAGGAMQVKFDESGQVQFVRSMRTCSCGSLIETVSVEYDVWFRQSAKSPCNAHNRYDHQENNEVRGIKVVDRCPECSYDMPYGYNGDPYNFNETKMVCEFVDRTKQE